MGPASASPDELGVQETELQGLCQLPMYQAEADEGTALP